MEKVLTNLDKLLIASSPEQKKKRLRLDVSKDRGTGSLAYVRVLGTEPVADAARLASAEALGKEAAKEFKKEAEGLEKGTTLLSHTKEKDACKTSLKKTCAAVKKIADIASNGFGETRVVLVKAGKKQALDACTTNANVGILLAAKDGAKVTVAD